MKKVVKVGPKLRQSEAHRITESQRPEAIKANIDTYIAPLVIGKNPIHFEQIMFEVSQASRWK